LPSRRAQFKIDQRVSRGYRMNRRALPRYVPCGTTLELAIGLPARYLGRVSGAKGQFKWQTPLAGLATHAGRVLNSLRIVPKSATAYLCT